jgi:hypothetical protein
MSLFLFAGIAMAQDKAATVAGNQISPATQNPAAVNPNAADIKFDVEKFNFGTIKQGDPVNYEFKFTNAGKDPLIITEARASCGCTVPEWPKEPIKKGESGVIKVTFNSTGKTGQQDKTVTINSNAKNSSVILHITGNVEAPSATPASITADPNEIKPGDKK